MADSQSSECNVDKRGARRGRCEEKVCNCKQYDGGSDRKKCCNCHHAPGKHRNLDQPSVQGVPRRRTCEGCRIEEVRSDFTYCTPSCRDMTLLGACAFELKASIEKLEADFQSLSPIRLKQCKAEGCGEAVFWDYKTEFQYCSPQCRNEDMLISAGLTLKSDIEDLEKQYSHLPAIEGTPSHTCGSNCLTKMSQAIVSGTQRVASGLASTMKSAVGTWDSKPAKISIEEKISTKEKISTMEAKISTKEAKISTKEEKISSKGVKSSKIKEVEFIKEENGEHGIIVCRWIWPLPEVKMNGYLITGVKMDQKLKSFKYMQSGQLCIFDCITEVNGDSVSASGNAQEELDRALSGRIGVKLTLCRPPFSLSSTGKLLSVLRALNIPQPSHIVAIVNPHNFDPGCGVEFGMEIDDNKTLTVPASGLSSAELCGLRRGDQFVASSVVEKDTFTPFVIGHWLSGASIYEQLKMNMQYSSDVIVAIIRMK